MRTCTPAPDHCPASSTGRPAPEHPRVTIVASVVPMRNAGAADAVTLPPNCTKTSRCPHVTVPRPRIETVSASGVRRERQLDVGHRRRRGAVRLRRPRSGLRTRNRRRRRCHPLPECHWPRRSKPRRCAGRSRRRRSCWSQPGLRRSACRSSRSYRVAPARRSGTRPGSRIWSSEIVLADPHADRLRPPRRRPRSAEHPRRSRCPASPIQRPRCRRPLRDTPPPPRSS